MKNEVWNDVKNYEGLYLVSNFGRIKSLDKTVKSGIFNNPLRFVPGKIMTPKPDKDGYLRIGLTSNFKKKIIPVHRIVAGAFLENPLNKPQVNHINGIKYDNLVENIEWATLSENRVHSYRTGLQNGLNRRGAKNNFVKLTKEQVIEIRRLYALSNVTQKELAVRFGITQGGVHNVVNFKSWNYL